MFIIYICIFFLGASLASYINATLYRIEKNIKLSTLLTESSYCEQCRKKLTWYELIPVFGYILIRGKCRNCGSKINHYYPISEAFLGVSFLLLYLNSSPFYIWIVLLFLFILSYYDFLYREIPQNLVHILLILSVLIFSLYILVPLSIFVTIGILLLVFLLSKTIKKSFGFGDILVLLSIGLTVLPEQFLIIFWFSILSALFYAILYGLITKKNLKEVKIPMIPFVTLSFLLGAVYGNEIFSTILQFLTSSF